MSNRFSCNFSGEGDTWTNLVQLFDRYLGHVYGNFHRYYFFSCAYPLVTSAAIKDVTINSRFYYVKRLKLDYCILGRRTAAQTNPRHYMMVFVLNIPQDYDFNFVLPFRLSELPNHKIPENVLYYDLITLDQVVKNGYVYRSKNVHIDITKPFKVLPSYKLCFYVFYIGASSGDGGIRFKEGAVEIFFDVN